MLIERFLGTDDDDGEKVETVVWSLGLPQMGTEVMAFLEMDRARVNGLEME